MRDLLLMCIFVSGSVYALKRPWVGAVLSVWVSLMSPHVGFGYAVATWPVAMMLAVPTVIGMAVTPDRQNPFLALPVWLLFSFWIWTCITLPFSFFFDASYPLWLRSSKIFVLVFMTLALINTRKKLEWLILAIVISLGFYGVKGGLFTILTGGSYRVWGPGGFVEGNNELALALVALMPFVRYLQMSATHRYAKAAATATLLLLPVTVLGSHSRGGLLALGAMAFFLWLKGDRKALYGVTFIAVGVMALSIMPPEWWSRMDTIGTYQSDESAMGRINAWWNAFNIAKRHVFGGGFMIYFPEVFAVYAPDPDDVHAAHSIYFQVLGEHGFIGLFLFMSIGAATWFTSRGLIKAGRADPELKWAANLGAMVQVSVIGFAVGGAFLSLAYFDLPYFQMAIVCIAHGIVRQHKAKAVRLPAMPDAPLAGVAGVQGLQGSQSVQGMSR